MGSEILRLLLAAIAMLALIPVSPASALERLAQYGVGVATGSSGGISAGAGVAVAPDGTVAVADLGAARLSLFAQSGRFLRAFGADVSVAPGAGAEVCSRDCKPGRPGSGAGELSGPWGVAAGASEVYVSELGNARVSVFDYGGRFLRAFGADVGGAGIDLCVSACLAGSSGPAAGEMEGPAGIAIDASGSLLVAELGSNRVDVFDPRDGDFLRAFGKGVGGPGVDVCTDTCASGVADGDPGSVNGGYGLSASPTEEVLVSEAGPSRVSVFSDRGKFLRAFGDPGPGAGELLGPQGVAVSSTGTVYVADSGNNRLAAFAADGDFGWAFGLDVSPGEPRAPETCVASCQTGASGTGIGELSNPQAVAVDCRGAVYIATLGRIDKFGEGGVEDPPCSAASPSGDLSDAPSGGSSSPLLGSTPAMPARFRFERRRRNARRGTLTVTVFVPGPGTLAVRTGRRLATKTRQPTAAGTIPIVVRAVGGGVETLRRRGGLEGVVSVTFTAANGAPATKSSRVRLVRRSRHRVYPH